jgi:antitoxin component YwqK of YwqJK toxin-antitoxin module
MKRNSVVAKLHRLGMALPLGLFICLGPFQEAHAQVQDCELNGQSVNLSNGSTTAGKTGLVRCVDRQSGQLRREQALVNGRFMGVVRYYEEGKLTRDYQVNEKGNRDGPYKEFNREGDLIVESIYHDGNNIGVFKRYHGNRQLHRLSFYESRAQTQSTQEIASAVFSENGQLSELRCAQRPVLKPHGFDDETACGYKGLANLELFRTGRLSSKQRWLQGRLVRDEILSENGNPRSLMVRQSTNAGEEQSDTLFYATGVKRRETLSLLSNGAAGERQRFRLRETEFSERGTAVSEKRYAQNRLQQETAWYLNGQLRNQSTWNDDFSRRNDKSFYDDGKLAQEGQYANSEQRNRGTVPVGSHRSFDQQQRLRAESMYDDKGRLTREREFGERGETLRDDEVFEDGSRRAFAR